MTADPEAFVTALMAVNLALAGRCAAQPDVEVSEALKERMRWALVERTQDAGADLRARIAAGVVLGELDDPRFERRQGPHGDYLLPPLVEIPAGTYTIGSDEGHYDDESPAHLVELVAFRLGQFPVTNAEWALFIEAGGYEDERWWVTEEEKAWRRGEGTAEGPKQQIREWRETIKADFGRFRQLPNVTSVDLEQWEALIRMSDEEFEAQLNAWYPSGRQTQPAFWNNDAFYHRAQPVVGICWFEARVDHHSWQDSWTADPRLALRWQATQGHRLRLAWGIYHQAPDARYLDAQRGNPDLDVMHAEHWALGYGFRDAADPFHLRVEVYAKKYDALPLESERSFFASDGTGEAQGLDLFARLAAARWDGWVSYSYLRARRRWTPWADQGRYPVPRRPVSPYFEIPHTLQLSGNVQLPGSVTLGASVRVASGRPFTPVEDAESTEAGFVPTYGARQSERYPTYQRLDLTVSRAWRIPGEDLAVGYLGITNLLDRQNIFEYAYSEDYRSREPARSSFGRAIYFGVSFQLSADGESKP